MIAKILDQHQKCHVMNKIIIFPTGHIFNMEDICGFSPFIIHRRFTENGNDYFSFSFEVYLKIPTICVNIEFKPTIKIELSNSSSLESEVSNKPRQQYEDIIKCWNEFKKE